MAANFRVCDGLGTSIGTPDVVSTFRLVQIINGTQSQVVDLAPQGAGRTTAFRWESGQHVWTFDIETANLVPGATYVYSIGLNDGTSIGFRFSVR